MWKEQELLLLCCFTVATHWPATATRKFKIEKQNAYWVKTTNTTRFETLQAPWGQHSLSLPNIGLDFTDPNDYKSVAQVSVVQPVQLHPGPDAVRGPWRKKCLFSLHFSAPPLRFFTCILHYCYSVFCALVCCHLALSLSLSISDHRLLIIKGDWMGGGRLEHAWVGLLGLCSLSLGQVFFRQTSHWANRQLSTVGQADTCLFPGRELS